MRIGLNLLYLVPGAVGGTEIYARHLVDALARLRPDDEFVAFAGNEAAPTFDAWPANVTVKRVPVKAASKPLRIAAELTLLPAAARRAKVDVLHSVGTTSPVVTAGVPSVVTIHDLIYEHFPATFPPAARAGLKALVGPGARRATRVHAISEFTKRDVIEHLRVKPERIDVVLNGFGIAPGAPATPPATLRERFGLGDGRVVLCVSAALEHKNLRRLIEAMRGVDAHLVIAGHAGRETFGEQEGVTFTGWLDDADLEGLYRLATCAVYPSLFEGFGMPALEAMARDVPLACSNATSLPEVTGDAAELFDPLDVAAMREAIRKVLTRPPELVERGRERVKAFSWERCAEGVWAIYEKAASSPAST